MSHPMQRIDQLLASLGYGSRREVSEWVRDGLVSVKGVPAKDPGARVDPADVTIESEPLDHPGELLILLNKPAGVVCSHDEREGPSIYTLIPERWRRRNPPVTSIGRLDKETTGLLLLTDKSGLVHRLTSPKH
jgi:16S rRNA pseudouridine516 synthase